MNLMEKWKKFFCDAGVPASEASTYAYKFAHNRIQTNMLTELNKDYLKDMGITIMGDVIAILRHSKQVYEEIQKSGKIEIPEENKDLRKEKEPVLKSKKPQVDPKAVKIESKTLSKPPSARTAVKRKSEMSLISSKKKPVDPVKKVIDASNDLNNDNIEECEDLGYVMIDSSKKALLFNQKISNNVEKQLKTLAIEKKPEKPINEIDNEFLRNVPEEYDDDDDHVEVIINDPIVNPYNGYRKYQMQDKYETAYSKYKDYSKSVNIQMDINKRAVFKRLGDDISQHSVTSTTPFDDEEQNSFTSKKIKEDTAKVSQEKNSVFHRLGQKCDVSSTSADAVANEDKKSAINLEFAETNNKSNSLLSKGKITVKRKVKVAKNLDNSESCIPSCVRSTYSEGILGANSSHDRKLTLKERLGLSKLPKDFTKLGMDLEYASENKFRKSYPNDIYERKSKNVLTSKKKVSFGSVSQKLIPSREEAIQSGELAVASERISVFDRLGFNRTF